MPTPSLSARSPGTVDNPEPLTVHTGGDTDGDGVPDVNDRCPNDPEDLDGFQDQDGCPD